VLSARVCSNGSRTLSGIGALCVSSAFESTPTMGQHFFQADVASWIAHSGSFRVDLYADTAHEKSAPFQVMNASGPCADKPGAFNYSAQVSATRPASDYTRASSLTIQMLSCRSRQNRLSGSADDQSRNHGTSRKLLDAAGRRAWKQEVKNKRATGASNAKRSNDTAQSIPLPIWMETEARVTECHHGLSRVRKLSLRVTEDPDNVIVSFTYYAHARTYYDNFISACSQGAR